jgi:hypothetical protein
VNESSSNGGPNTEHSSNGDLDRLSEDQLRQMRIIFETCDSVSMEAYYKFGEASCWRSSSDHRDIEAISKNN